MYTWRLFEMRARLQELVKRYGLFETLDHFYDSVDVAPAIIQEEER